VIVLDTSAILAIVLREPAAQAVAARLAEADAVAVSAGTLAEILVVADRRGVRDLVANALDRIGVEVVPVGAAEAAAVADAYARWGRGVHPAGLDFGDCFAYALAAARRAPLLFVGEDFAATDAVPAVARTPG